MISKEKLEKLEYIKKMAVRIRQLYDMGFKDFDSVHNMELQGIGIGEYYNLLVQTAKLDIPENYTKQFFN